MEKEQEFGSRKLSHKDICLPPRRVTGQKQHHLSDYHLGVHCLGQNIPKSPVANVYAQQCTVGKLKGHSLAPGPRHGKWRPGHLQLTARAWPASLWLPGMQTQREHQASSGRGSNSTRGCISEVVALSSATSCCCRHYRPWGQAFCWPETLCQMR